MPDKRLKATALRYKPSEDQAPKVVAKGSGKLAERIIAIARQNNVPLKEDPKLVEILSTLDLYQEIPPELYRAVAEILVYIYRTSKKLERS